MANTTSAQTLRMIFRNHEGKNVTISLNDPREDLTAAEIQSVMDLIIARNIVASSGGDLVSKQDIKMINNITDDLFDPLT